MYIIAQGCRLRNDLYCVEWDVKLYYTIPCVIVQSVAAVAEKLCDTWIVFSTIAGHIRRAGNIYNTCFMCCISGKYNAVIDVHVDWFICYWLVFVNFLLTHCFVSCAISRYHLFSKLSCSDYHHLSVVGQICHA